MNHNRLNIIFFHNNNPSVLLLAIIKGMLAVLAPIFIMKEFPNQLQLLGYISIYFSIAYLFGSISASMLTDKVRNFIIGLLQVLACLTGFLLVSNISNLFIVYSIFIIGFLTLSEMQTYNYHFYQKNYVQDMHQGLSKLEAQWQTGAFGAGLILLVLALLPLKWGFVTCGFLLIMQSIFFWRWKMRWPRIENVNTKLVDCKSYKHFFALLTLENVIDSSISVIPLLLSQILYVIFPIVTYAISHQYQQFYFTVADKLCVISGIFAALCAHLFRNKLIRSLILSITEMVALILLVLSFPQSVILLFVVAVVSSLSIYVYKINLISIVYKNTTDNNFKHNYALRAILKTIFLFIIGVITNHLTNNLLGKLLIVYILLVILLIIYITISYKGE